MDRLNATAQKESYIYYIRSSNDSDWSQRVVYMFYYSTLVFLFQYQCLEIEIALLQNKLCFRTNSHDYEYYIKKSYNIYEWEWNISWSHNFVTNLNVYHNKVIVPLLVFIPLVIEIGSSDADLLLSKVILKSLLLLTIDIKISTYRRLQSYGQQ